MKTIILAFIICCLTSCEINHKTEHSDFSPTSNHSKSVLPNRVEEIKLNQQVALDFIDSYILNCNKMNKAQNIVDWTFQSPLVTERFKIKLKKLVTDAFISDPEYGLGFDPIINGQDYPDDGFEFDSFNSKTGKVTVKGIGEVLNKIAIKLVVQNGKTLVDGCGAVNMN